MKEVKKKKGILDDNTVITLGNIEKLSQCFALSALKGMHTVQHQKLKNCKVC